MPTPVNERVRTSGICDSRSWSTSDSEQMYALRQQIQGQNHAMNARWAGDSGHSGVWPHPARYPFTSSAHNTARDRSPGPGSPIEERQGDGSRSLGSGDGNSVNVGDKRARLVGSSSAASKDEPGWLFASKVFLVCLGVIVAISPTISSIQEVQKEMDVRLSAIERDFATMKTLIERLVETGQLSSLPKPGELLWATSPPKVVDHATTPPEEGASKTMTIPPTPSSIVEPKKPGLLSRTGRFFRRWFSTYSEPKQDEENDQKCKCDGAEEGCPDTN